MTKRNVYEALRALFETRKRDDSSIFVALEDEAPEWAGDFVREAHGTDMLPDDWRYNCITDALETLADSPDSDPDELEHEFADNVDVYSSDLLEWVGSHLERQGYVDEARHEGLVAEDATLDQRIMAGQYQERAEIFRQVVAAVELFEDEIGEYLANA